MLMVEGLNAERMNDDDRDFTDGGSTPDVQPKQKTRQPTKQELEEERAKHEREARHLAGDYDSGGVQVGVPTDGDMDGPQTAVHGLSAPPCPSLPGSEIKISNKITSSGGSYKRKVSSLSDKESI